MGRTKAFYKVPVIPGLHAISGQYAEAERIQLTLGGPGSDYTGAFAEPDSERRNQEEDTAGTLSSQLRIGHCSLRYRADFPFCDRPCEPAVGNGH